MMTDAEIEAAVEQVTKSMRAALQGATSVSLDVKRDVKNHYPSPWDADYSPHHFGKPTAHVVGNTTITITAHRPQLKVPFRDHE